MGKYFDEIVRSMDWLGKKPDTLFIGQAVGYEGTAMSTTLKNVDTSKKLELPVFEDTQTGMALGLALTGYIPISIYPRWNFLLLGTNQIVNHIDKIPLYSTYKPKVIIRTGIGSERPLHPGHQHTGDFTLAFTEMCETIEVIRLDRAEQIFPAYQKAYERNDGKSTIIVEWSDFYNET